MTMEWQYITVLKSFITLGPGLSFHSTGACLSTTVIYDRKLLYSIGPNRVSDEEKKSFMKLPLGFFLGFHPSILEPGANVTKLFFVVTDEGAT
jgi:hypothetical protein